MINHKLNEKLVMSTTTTPEERLYQALKDLFKIKGVKIPLDLVDYYMDAFIHSAKGLIDSELARHISIASK